MIEQKFIDLIAEEIKSKPAQVEAAITLFDKGATVPFVARYRKDVTGNLDEIRLECIETRNGQFIALINRRDAILENIAKQEKLSPELREEIRNCITSTELEDLYLPFKKQRRTKASVAREQGLEPLAEFLLAQIPGEQSIDAVAAGFVNSEKLISSPEEALAGALNIIAEQVSLDPHARRSLREAMQTKGKIVSTATKAAEEQPNKFQAYYAYNEDLRSMPSHRLLAILRGARLGFLRMDLELDDEGEANALTAMFLKDPASEFAPHISSAVLDAYKRLLRPSIENEVLGLAREKADQEAIQVFRENAEHLLLAPPAGRLVVIGVDPGLRTGCKLAVVDNTGAYKAHATIYPTEPKNDIEGATRVLAELIEAHGVQAVAIGNGTGSRETGKFIDGVLEQYKDKGIFSVFVNESGASVYSASKLAREEFPDLDITFRGAISIARRLQDPLAELVKVEPRSIGVGQYQHDVNQRSLRDGLYKTVESCVNRVGVNLNTASAELLRYISGIQMGTAQNIVQFRTEKGGFKSREELKEVSGIGEKTFQQCVGFLRIPEASNPLDRTSIHPEAYPIVEKIAEKLGVATEALVESRELLKNASLNEFSTETIGIIALEDIRHELMKPGRDPRKQFRIPKFLEGVHDLNHLEVGMESEGVVTNVTDFGAFVDIGVHQDGLVHLSELDNRFLKDPQEAVKVGDLIRVKVIAVDKEQQRISLSRKALLPPPRRRGPKRAAPHKEGEKQEGAQRPRRDSRNEQGEGKGRKTQGAREDRAPRKDRAPRPSRKPQQGGRRPQQQQSGGNESLGSTLLADQLEALKDKFK